ncbi:glycosyltransferase family 4 protein [Peribacillus frigoritolerans]|uniref:glycosyltransferase family 4 protein n=1 Tax=Peribacillus frigoritolerans TaxID=450367 RepID=UPI0020795BE7|nr:glycosyltransferase family 4 protein [Peribacillus frigoritolerans]USK82056.1 glycosyltransferase family 4 protein [Peribacillus frigoritolerans]WJE49348.1 glycosyltransferase family 4 protein [Peribacillus frigoritolerans]
MKILVLNFFPTILPPNTGGVLRYFHIYHELSKFYDITLLSQKYTPEVEVLNYSDTFREIKIPTDDVQHQVDENLFNEGIGPRFSTHAALSCALLDGPPPTFLQYYKQFYKKCDIVIHDSPFMLKYDINFGLDDKPRIYNSHNHESEFAKHVWYGKRSREYINHVTHLEKSLVNNAALVFATSEEDKKSFRKAFNVDRDKINLAPNGINPGEWNQRVNNQSVNSKVTALFIGSMHQPNIEIVEFIVSQLADKCENIDFIVAGQCGSGFSDFSIRNIKILGEVNQKQKLQLFSEADIAINPAFFGTGTKIKTLEFLSAGIPLVSTDIGVKGMLLEQGTHYFHANHQNFALILNKISKDRPLLETIALNGQRYINHNFSWEAIAKKLKKQLDTYIKK